MSERRFTDKPELDPSRVWALKPQHPAMIENRTLFPSTVVDVTKTEPERLLISGKENRKLGSHVEKGRFKGYAFYGLSLEERATCPASCDMRAACYGNAMHLARRHRILNEDVFYQRLENEISQLAGENDGVLIRLHVLGDFPSVEYVSFWSDILADYPNVACYGYTHRMHLKSDGDEIGQAIAALKSAQPDRFRIRWSRSEVVPDGATVIDHVPEQSRVGEAVVCPAQTDATACCATCAMCWEATRPVLFIKHGNKSTQMHEEARKEAAAVNDATDIDDEKVYELRERVAQLEGQVSDFAWIPEEWGVPRTEAKILNLLMARPILTREAAYGVLYAHDVEKEHVSPEVLDSHISKLRSRLQRVGMTIENRRYIGWSLPTETAHKLSCIKNGEPYKPIGELGSAIVNIELSTRPIIPISLPAGRKPNKLDKDRPDVRMVRVTELQIETAYQRNLSSRSIRLIRHIIENWDWSKFKPPIVADAGTGKYNVVDGQHTSIAAASHPQIMFLPCIVIDAPTVQSRAAAFVAHNMDRVAMSIHQIFIGRAKAGDPVAAPLLDIIERNRGTVPKFIPKREDVASGEIIGIGKLEEIFRAHGPEGAERCVRAVVKSGIKPANAMVFRALKLYLQYEKDHGTTTPEDVLIQALASFENLEADAEQLAAASGLQKYKAGLRLLIAAIGRIILEPTEERKIA